MIFRNADNRTPMQRMLDDDARQNRLPDGALDTAATQAQSQNFVTDRLWLQRARAIQFGDLANELTGIGSLK
jgi:hypothetical protein